MSLPARLDGLPRLLLVEVLLAAVVLLLGALPLAVLYWTPLTLPPGLGWVWTLPLLALAALWLTLVVHAIVDLVGLVRRPDATDPGDARTRLHAGFRLLATLGAAAAPVLPVVLFAGRGSPPQAGFALVLVGVLAAPLVASSVVVVLHVGWLVRSGGAGDRPAG